MGRGYERGERERREEERVVRGREGRDIGQERRGERKGTQEGREVGPQKREGREGERGGKVEHWPSFLTDAITCQ